MAQRALGSGTPVRRRALFGLVDRDGWAWAGIKAMLWFLLIILLMGYLPDRAYYFTVFSQIDLGIRSDALTPVNFCPPDNETLPCPARSEEHTSELQSRPHLVCRLLLEKKKN